MADSFIELKLLQRDRPSGFIDQLVSLLSDVAVDSASLKTGEFRNLLEIYRQRLAVSDGKPDFAGHAAECLQLCQDFYERSGRYLLDRETEFAEVIRYLRDAIGRLAGESTTFSSQLLVTSERMERLVDIEDIRELKKQISKEVQQLRRTVEEKREKYDATYSRLTNSVRLLRSSLEESRNEAALDGLTGVPNRRSFDRTLEAWLERRRRSANPFVLAMLDLDNFKAINDVRGHQVGDRVLLCAAQAFSKSVRPNDFVGRFGGEEFVALIADATTEQAQAKFKEILARLAATSYDYDVDGAPASITFTASCGLAECGPDESAESLLKRADEALYEAKKTGKNRVVAAPPLRKNAGFWNSLKPLVSRSA